MFKFGRSYIYNGKHEINFKRGSDGMKCYECFVPTPEKEMKVTKIVGPTVTDVIRQLDALV